MKKASKGPLVSVIVPVYNCEKYLKKCVKSILNQSYKDLDILLIDDGSTDGSGNICDDFAIADKRVKVFHLDNKGVSCARNTGLKHVVGDYITFVDSDDWIDSDYIDTLLKDIISSKSDISICSYNRVVGDKYSALNCEANNLSGEEYLTGILRVNNCAGVCYSKLYKAAIAKKSSFDEALSVGEDALYNIHISQYVEKVSVVSSVLYNYRISGNSVVRKYDINYPDKYLDSMLKAKEALQRLKIYDNHLVDYYNYVAFHAMLIAVNYCCNPSNKSKIRSLKELRNNELFGVAIQKCCSNSFSKAKQIVLFTLRHKLYLSCLALCKIRQHQNRLPNKGVPSE